MKPEDKKLIAEHLRESITREDMTNRQAAAYLEIKPYYISMVFNPKSWDGVSKEAWSRLEEWHGSRENIKDFKSEIPMTELPDTPKQPLDTPQKAKKLPKQPSKDRKPKVKQKRKTDPDKIQAEAFSKFSSTDAPFPVIPAVATPDVQFTDTARLKVALDIEINLVVNGQKVQVK